MLHKPEILKNLIKPVLILFVMVLTGLHVQGQQDPLYSQYMSNPYVINPAVAGTFPYYQIRSNNRFQWAGFKDAPITNTLSFFGPLRDQPMGVGGYIFNDIAGPETKTGIYGSYAYNYPITDEIKISMGLTAGVIQYRIDGSKLQFGENENTEDPLAFGSDSKLVPDASLGLYLYASDFHVGFASTKLLNNKLNWGESPTGLSKLKTHFYLTGGYKYFIDRDWAVEPTLILRAVSPAPVQLDGNVYVHYQNMLSLGLGWRTQDAITVALNYTHDKRIFIGISYDIGISDFRAYNNGSYEVVIGFKFDRLK